MTLTQKAYNQIAKRIEELKDIEKYSCVFDYTLIKNTRKVLEIKLMEISKELTAERYAQNY